MKLIPMIGVTFNRLTVLERVANNNERKAMYLCSCSCGKQTTTLGKELRNGRTKSCGCYGREVRHASVTTHGCASTKTYQIWRGIIDRCHNPNSHAYKWYGTKGIIVCKKWRDDFSTFLADMGERPDGMTIDRIKNHLGYAPGNCRWATRKQQANNKQNNVLFTCHGKSQTASQWADEIGIKRSTLYARLHSKRMTIERALSFKDRVVAKATLNGETKTMADWCRHFEIDYRTVRHRLKRKWQVEAALTTPTH